ncbi:hypothetical protein [Synechococcus elongatus]|uniref:hypothetical protein n=1 Tax=Synechococcus elongatus TaxID=32046 RepID=UPI000F7DB423|nr:hypothetical protein [Synechococcus elongatus]
MQRLTAAIAQVAEHERKNDFRVKPNVAANELQAALIAALPSLIEQASFTLPLYADNTAAIAGGLTAGRLYRNATNSVQVVV